MVVERAIHIAFEVVSPQVNRLDFGFGQAGEAAYEMVIEGYGCETLVDNNRQQCGKSSIGTVDFDVAGATEQFPVCSPQHEIVTRERIAKDLRRSPLDNTFGRNGRERA